MVWRDFYQRSGHRAGHSSGRVNLFTAANLIKDNIDDVAKEAIPFVVMDVIVLIILSLFPILSLYLLVLVGLYSP